MGSQTNEAIGERIKRLRRTSNLSQQKVATESGIAYSTLSKLEQGSTKSPSVAVLYKLSQVLKFNIDDLLAGKTSLSSARLPLRFVYSDIGGVLAHTEHVFLQALSLRLGRPLPSVRALYYTYAPFAERGNLTLRDLQLLYLLKLNIKFKGPRRKALFRHWVDDMQPIIPMHMFLREIAAQYPVGLLTNTTEGFVERMFKRSLLPDIKYRVIVKSCDEGAIKPELNIYEIAQRRARVRPSEILFIDNEKPNVAGARSAGWQAEWFNELKPTASIARIRRKYF